MVWGIWETVTVLVNTAAVVVPVVVVAVCKHLSLVLAVVIAQVLLAGKVIPGGE